MEIRYIVFTLDEAKTAVVTYLQRQRHSFRPGGIASVDIAGPNAVIVRSQEPAAEPVNLDTQYVIAALLLYCVDHRIPVPKQAEKKVELSIDGLTLILTTDRSQGSPVVSRNQVTYGEMVNRATQTISTVREELARAVARASHAEGSVARAQERADKAEAARAEASAMLVAIAMVPGLRGWLGRWLVSFKAPT